MGSRPVYRTVGRRSVNGWHTGEVTHDTSPVPPTHGRAQRVNARRKQNGYTGADKQRCVFLAGGGRLHFLQRHDVFLVSLNCLMVAIYLMPPNRWKSDTTLDKLFGKERYVFSFDFLYLGFNKLPRPANEN